MERVKMVRRDFIHRTLAGAASLAPLVGAVQTTKNEKLTYRVAGFTCVTCAVGLETILGREKGVAHVEAAYPSGIVKVEFDAALLNDKSLRGLIEEMGFRVVEGRRLRWTCPKMANTRASLRHLSRVSVLVSHLLQ
jgi:copper chaperone CopZ